MRYAVEGHAIVEICALFLPMNALCRIIEIGCTICEIGADCHVRELSDVFVYLFSDEFKMTQEPVYKMEFGTLIPKMLSVFTLTFTFMVKIQVKGRGTA